MALNSTELLQLAIIREPFVSTPDATVRDAIAQMSRLHSEAGSCPTFSDKAVLTQTQFHNVHDEARSSCVLIIEQHQVVGILTERDIVRLQAQQQSLDDLLIRQCMTEPTILLRESNIIHLQTLKTIFQQFHIQQLPVLDDQDRLVGLVTTESLLLALNCEEPGEPDQSRCTEAQLETQNVLLTEIIQQTKQILNQTEERYCLATRAAKVGVWEWNLKTNEFFLDPNVKGLLGYTNSEIPNDREHWLALVHPDDREGVLAAAQAHLAGETPEYVFEHRMQHKNGSIVWILLRGKLLRDLQGNPERMLGTDTDISDRKLAELQLQELNRELEAKVAERTADLLEKQHFIEQFMESSTAILYIYDVWEGRNLYVNQQMRTVLGYSPEDIQAMGTNFLPRLVHPDDFPHLMEHLQEFLATGAKTVIDVEYRMRHASGEWRWLQSRDCLFKRTPEGLPYQMIGTAIDISDRKQAELALRQSEERYRLLTEVSPVGVFRFNTLNHCIYANETLLQMVGYPIEAYLQDQWLNTIHPDDRQDTYERWQAYREQATVDPTTLHQMEFRQLHPDGTVVWVLAQVVAECDESGHITGYVGTLTDISDRKYAEQQLQQLNQALELKVQERTAKLLEREQELLRATQLKDEFLANMSHELRTPLNVILGMTEGMLAETLGSVSPDQIKALQMIENSGTHLLELINDILDLAKVESGQMELRLESTSLYPICQTSLDFIQKQALKKQIHVEMVLAQGLPNLWGDPTRIRQVLINLLTNAVKFTPERGRITLEASFSGSPQAPQVENGTEAKSFIQIRVFDTGIGIAPEHLSKLFKPFVQIDSALNRKYAGTGLGLSLVKRIVELHGGKVGLVSEVGVGSCFTIDLPCVSSAASAVQEPRPGHLNLSLNPSDPVKPALILLAEDNPTNAWSLMSYLKAKGHHLIWAKDGEETITVAQANPPDLILMDVQMPGIDGLEVIQRLRQNPKFATIPIIALTALAMKGDRDRCLASGANDYLSKPVKLKDLAQKIQQLLVWAAELDAANRNN